MAFWGKKLLGGSGATVVMKQTRRVFVLNLKLYPALRDCIGMGLKVSRVVLIFLNYFLAGALVALI